jgi:uncharacterized protein with GYD domain
MPRFVVLIDWTDQGIRAAKESPARAAQSRDAFKRMGVEIESIYWTMGGHDLVAVLNATDGESVTAALLQLAAAGNVRTKTLRAFDESEFNTILSKLG